MRPPILAIRSIGAEYANRLYLVVAISTSIVSAIVLGGSIWLTSLSSWWWILVAILIVAVSIAIGILVIIKLVIRSITPSQTKQQKTQVKSFVDALDRVSEVAQTSKFTLFFKIVRDIAAPRENGFIASISNDGKTLRHDFKSLIDTFK